MNVRRWSVLALTLLLMSALIGCGDAGLESEREEEAVAIVNGEAIPRNEFDDLLEVRMEMYQMQMQDMDDEEAAEMMDMLKQHTLDELIAQTVLMQRAEAAGMVADDEAVEEEYRLLKEQYDDEEFQRALDAQNLTSESLKENIALQLAVHQYVDEKVEEEIGKEAVEVSDDELKAFYEQYSMQMEDPPEFEEMKPQLEGMVQQEKMQEVTAEIVNQLVEESEIEILL